jgi:hypothetical protein
MASQQRRRRGLPQPNTNANAGKSDANAGKSDANGHSYGYIYAGKSYADGYGNNHTTTPDAYTLGDPASADAKAAAHAVSSADAVTASE